jgi:hypothetical protein
MGVVVPEGSRGWEAEGREGEGRHTADNYWLQFVVGNGFPFRVLALAGY